MTVVCLVFLGIAILVLYPGTQRPNFQAVDQQIYLSEGRGWSGGYEAPLRQLFYYTPQGTTVKGLPYSWFVNLEVPLGKPKFASPDRMNAYGFLVDGVPTPANPDLLPWALPTTTTQISELRCSTSLARPVTPASWW